MNPLAGTGDLTRLALRRDRLRIPGWALGVGAMAAYGALALDTVYPTATDRQTRAALMDSPAAVMMSGPGYGLEDYTLGAIMANEYSLTLMVAVAIMSILLVVRHTRAEEESGRAELLHAGVVGRDSLVTSALLAAAVANVAVALASAGALVAAGLATADSLAFGVGIGATGMVFAGVAAVTAQVTEHARAATGAALAVLGVAFVVRAAGDIAERGGSALSWLSPIAWSQQTRAFVDLRWWPLLLPLALVATAVPAAYALRARRDLGAGLVAQRPGRAEASAALSTPFALSLRLQRGQILAWATGLLLLGATTGTLVESVSTMLEDNPEMADVFGTQTGDLTDGYLAVMVLFIALVVGGYTVSSALRLRSEEAAGRAETVLATGVSRWGWMGQGLLVTTVGTTVLLLAAGLGLGLSAAATLADPFLWLAVVGAALAYLPSLLVLAGLVALATGLRPALAGLVWVVLAYGFVVGMFGPLLGLPDWATRLSPFAAAPALPGGTLDPAALAVLALAAGALGVAGLATFRRRDLVTT